MEHEVFVGQVQHRARLASRPQAEDATAATLATLAERLTGDAAENLAAQLPQEIARYLQEAEFNESFDLDTFFERVSEREGIEVPEAVHHVRCVLAVLQEAVAPGALDNVRAQLPAAWAPLFDAGSEGPLRLEGEGAGARSGNRRW